MAITVTRRAVSGGLLAGFAMPQALAAGGDDKTDDPPYACVVTRGVMVPMRDGTRLATDIYRPARDGQVVPGRHPAIIERTPYGRDATTSREATARRPGRRSRAEIAASFVARGYVVVFQDCRGRGGSEGEFVKYLGEATDGVDACRWIVAQDWSDGQIAGVGTSYGAHTQAAMASLGAPGLKAMFLDFGGFNDAWDSGIRQSGAFELKQVTWALTFGAQSPRAMTDPNLRRALGEIDVRGWFQSMPWKPGSSPLALLPDYEDYVFEQWRHGAFDAGWRQPGIYAAGFYPQLAKVESVHLSGWFDAYARSTIRNFQGLRAEKKAPARLIMGPWTHGARSSTISGDIDLGPNATFEAATGRNYLEYRLALYDRALRGRVDPRGEEPPVRLFVMGGGSGRKTGEGRLDHGGRWRAENDWPPPSMTQMRLYLGAEGCLSPDLPARGVAPLSYQFDPKDPVPTIGGTVTSGEPVMSPGGFDQRETPDLFGARAPFLPLAARPDVLVFQTPTLDEDLEIIGEVEARLCVSSDCPDTDFTIKLVDVYPPSVDYASGYALAVAEGILRCRYRHSRERPAPMVPGRIEPITLLAFPTANLFRRGHRLRIDISSSNFPHFDVNPNTGGPEGAGLVSRIATNSIHVDAAHPSYVVLPVVPSSRPGQPITT